MIYYRKTLFGSGPKLTAVLCGCTNKQVGQNLHISLKTVEAHRANVMDKLGVNRAATLLKLSITNQQYH